MNNKILAIFGIGTYFLSVLSSATDLEGNSVAPSTLVAISGIATAVFIIMATIRLYKEARGVAVAFVFSSGTLFILSGIQAFIMPSDGSPLLVLLNITKVINLLVFVWVVIRLFKSNRTINSIGLTSAEPDSVSGEGRMNIYIGIDGVLLDEKNELIENVDRFLRYVTVQHHVYWLLKRGTEEEKIKILWTKLTPETAALLGRINHAEWVNQRTDGIDYSQEFRLFIKSVSSEEIRTLRDHNAVTDLFCANGKVGIETVADRTEYFEEHGVPTWLPIQLNLSYTPDQFKLIQNGFDRGRNMDYKWHIYLLDDWLYFDRSWTDYCAYKIRFELKDGLYTATEAYSSLASSNVSADARNQYHGDLIKELIQVHLLDVGSQAKEEDGLREVRTIADGRVLENEAAADKIKAKKIVDVTRFLKTNVLIAGCNRSGKSNFMELLVASILRDSRPRDTQLVIIDPKRVEFSFLNGVPHLLRDVVFEVDATKQVFENLWTESSRRLDLISGLRHSSIEFWNEVRIDEERIPNILLVIDEMADFMVDDPKFYEDYIEKITAVSQRTGIFIIMATSRIEECILTRRILDCFMKRVAFRMHRKEQSHLVISEGIAATLTEPGSAYVQDVVEGTLDLVQMPYIKYEEFAKIVERAQGSERSK